MPGGIRLIQRDIVFNGAGVQHPAPIAIGTNSICYLSFTGSLIKPVKYNWAITSPDDPHVVVSSVSSPGPSFFPASTNAAYNISLTDENGVIYQLDIVTPTVAPDASTSLVTTVHSITALRALLATASTNSVSVEYRSQPGDGGGGHFDDVTAISTAPDDDGVFFHSNERIWRRRYDALLNVQWWGARGDGVTDDRAAIQAAIMYAQAHTTGTAIGGPGPDTRYTSPRLYFPGGKTWVIGRIGAFTHGLELPGTVHLVGDRGTVFVPRRAATTVDATTDTFTCASHGFAVDEPILVAAPQGTMPGAVKDGELYYVIASGFTTGAFKIALTRGGAAVDVTSNGTGVFVSVAHAIICLQIARSHIQGIQFSGGVHAIKLGGATSNFGTLPAFFSAEYGGNIVECQFINQAGPSVWQDMTPVSAPQNYRTTGPIRFAQCGFRGPSFWWGLSDKLDFSHCTFIWDMAQYIADQDAGLPSLLHSGDGLHLGAINTCDNVFFDHCFIDPLGPIAGKKWPERNAFGVGMGGINFINTIWGELSGCLWRARGIANSYKGLGEAAVTFDGAIGIANAPFKLTCDGACLFDVFTKNIVEVYDQPISALRFGRGDETNMGGTWGVWVDAGVTIASMLQRQQSQQMLQSDYFTGPVVRWRQSAEVNGFEDIGGHPRGNPIRDGAGIIDITGIFEAYWHQRPYDDFHVNARAQNNLFLPGLYKPVRGGNSATQVIIPVAINFAGESSDSSTGYTLPIYTTGATDGALFFSTPVWGTAMSAGVYCFSCDVKSTADILWVFQYTYDGHQCQVGPRKVTGAVGGYQRYEFSFYFPGGGVTFSFQGGAYSLPAATALSFGRFKIERGRKSTPYTFPVNDAVTPTANTVAPKQPQIYFGSAMPTTGTYLAGDIMWNNNPTAIGQPMGWVSLADNTGGGAPTFAQFAVIGP